jgi:3-oxoacyl-[acyl-carrier-protein] synthase II
VHRHGLLDGHAQHRRGGRGHPPRRLVAAIAGSTETPLHELVHIGFSNMRGMGTAARGRRGDRVSRPFDIRPQRVRPRRGRGSLVVEDLELAKARGATIYAEVVGYGSAADAWDLIQPVEKGDGVRRALSRRSSATACPPSEIDLINPHGTSTPLGDLREAQAFWAVFGDRTPEISDQRDQVDDRPPDGRRRRRRGVFTILSVHHQCAPASQLPRPDPEINLNVVRSRRVEREIRYAMSDNIGLGGHNGAVVFKRYDGD